MKTFAAELDYRAADSDDRTVPVTISSEYPVGGEVLSHDKDAIDLTRAPLPLCIGHNSTDVNIGLVRDLHIVDGSLKGSAVFGSSARALELFEDVKIGIVRNLSVGYRVHKTTKTKGGYIATRWEPFEVSVVGAPADINAGFFRSEEKDACDKEYDNRTDKQSDDNDSFLHINAARARELQLFELKQQI